MHVYVWLTCTHIYIHAWGQLLYHSLQKPLLWHPPPSCTNTHTLCQTSSQRIHEVGQLIEEEFTLILRILVMRWAPHPVLAWKKKGALLKILLCSSPADRMVMYKHTFLLCWHQIYFFFSSKVLGVSHRVRSQLTWPKLEICAWQDSLLSHDLCSHHGHALKLTFFPLLPVFSSSTLILHPSYSGTLMLKCF